LAVAAAVGVVAVLVIAGNHIAQNDLSTSGGAGSALSLALGDDLWEEDLDGLWGPDGEWVDDALDDEVAARLPDTIVASVVDVTQSSTPWGGSFTLEIPHPLLDGYAIVVRAWLGDPHSLLIESGQEIEFTQIEYGESEYALADVEDAWFGDAALTWGQPKWRPIFLCDPDGNCASEDEVSLGSGGVQTHGKDVEDLGDCVIPFLGALLFTDASGPDLFPSVGSEEINGRDESGLVLATASAREDDEGTFFLLAVTENPDTIRGILSGIELTPRGAWAAPPPPPFAYFDQPAGPIVGLPETISAKVVSVTETNAPWGTSATIEMPHPLRREFTVLLRSWYRVPRSLSWKPNQKVKFTRDGPGRNSYSSDGDLPITFSWEEMEAYDKGGGASHHPCVRAQHEESPASEDTRARDGCVGPELWPPAFVDPYPNRQSTWDAWAEGVGGVPGLTLTSWSAFGDENMTFTLLAVVDNPGPVREALSSLELTEKGKWAKRPAALFAFNAPGEVNLYS